VVRALRAYGEFGARITLAAARDRDGVALIDECGALTFGADY
jgi:fatty-acyl-CoA synthase